MFKEKKVVNYVDRSQIANFPIYAMLMYVLVKI